MRAGLVARDGGSLQPAASRELDFFGRQEAALQAALGGGARPEAAPAVAIGAVIHPEARP